MLALACGDALANGAEFQMRGSYHITGMDAHNKYFPAGLWSDDTGLTLCLAESLLENQGFNPLDQMQRYIAFYDEGKGFPGKYPLRAGTTTNQALLRFKKNPQEPYAGSTHPMSAGNGGLMRLLPVVIASHSNLDQCRQWAIDSTRVTHAASECLEASSLLAEITWHLLHGVEKHSALKSTENVEWYSTKIASIASASYLNKSLAGIRAKTYVADTLEAALWCFATTDTLEEALLAAANLGDDCDTVAAITGQLAGCYYGVNNLPTTWLNTLVQRDHIAELAQRLL